MIRVVKIAVFLGALGAAAFYVMKLAKARGKKRAKDDVAGGQYDIEIGEAVME